MLYTSDLIYGLLVKSIVFTYLCGMKKDQIQTLPPLSVTLSLEEYQGLLDRLRLSEQKDLEYVQKILENEQTIRAKEQEILDKKQEILAKEQEIYEKKQEAFES